MSSITEYADDLDDLDNELKLALYALQKLVDAIPNAENKPLAASEAWQAWKQLNDTYQLDKTKPYPDKFQWAKVYIVDYLTHETKSYPFNDGYLDPITLDPINNPLNFRSGHQLDASSLLQHFQAGHRFNPLTQEATPEDEFNELAYQLVSACYSNQIKRENSMLLWHYDIGRETLQQHSSMCLLFLCLVANWINSGCVIDTPLIPVMLLYVPLMQKIFGHNVFLGLPAIFDNRDNHGKMKLPICLSVFKVANNASTEANLLLSPQR